MMTAATPPAKMHMDQWNVTTAFLSADLEEEVYLEIPKKIFHVNIAGNVLRLLKALYSIQHSLGM